LTVWSVEDDDGKEPSSWRPIRFASIGGGEPFVHQIMQELPQLLEAGSITEAQRRERAKEAILLIGIEGLMPTLNCLKQIRSLQGSNLPEMDRRQLYDNFGGKLWRAYKELMPAAAREIGFQIGFLFEKSPAGFESELKAFQARHPEVRTQLGEYLRDQRGHWHSDLAHWRNQYLEHPHKSWKDVKPMYEVGQAEVLFDSAWTAIVIILAVLTESKLWPGWSLQELPEAERNPNVPNWFCLAPPSTFTMNRKA
jgi:hypothetical protein